MVNRIWPNVELNSIRFGAATNLLCSVALLRPIWSYFANDFDLFLDFIDRGFHTDWMSSMYIHRCHRHSFSFQFTTRAKYNVRESTCAEVTEYFSAAGNLYTPWLHALCSISCTLRCTWRVLFLIASFASWMNGCFSIICCVECCWLSFWQSAKCTNKRIKRDLPCFN